MITIGRVVKLRNDFLSLFCLAMVGLLVLSGSGWALTGPFVMVDELSTGPRGVPFRGWVDPTDNTYYTAENWGPAQYALINDEVTLLKSGAANALEKIQQ